MLPLDDSHWQNLLSGYKIPYDASIPLRQMESGEDVWEELWENLHHQGDVGEASYAALPHLVRICEIRGTRGSLYDLASTIEVERHRSSNPPLPDWLMPSYTDALNRLVQLALRDLATMPEPYFLQSALSIISLGRGALKLGAVLNCMDKYEIEEYVDEHLSWSELYD